MNRNTIPSVEDVAFGVYLDRICGCFGCYALRSLLGKFLFFIFGNVQPAHPDGLNPAEAHTKTGVGETHISALLEWARQWRKRSNARFSFADIWKNKPS
jgi:hypothetical protein